MKILVLIALFCLTISGCSTIPEAGTVTGHKPAPVTASQSGQPDNDRIRQQLLSQYHQWKGVRYRLGGLSRKGIDCSGFVYLTYHDQLGIPIPRTTEQQARVGRAVARQSLASGDLVFFKTGVKVRHVGIYVGKGQFIHASSSSGVMLSGLNDPYWRDRYWHARRVAAP